MTTILERLLATADQRGDAPAIVTGGRTHLTYRELYGRAAELARRLTSDGCGPESIVALDLPLSAEHVVALLGVWLSGAAFAPVDTRYPAARKRQALELMAPRVVLSGLDVPSATARVVAPALRPEHLAYVICSSGTTGPPKAVAVTHRGIPAVIEAQVRLFELEPRSRVLWTLAPAFDASISDILTTLLAGAALYIEPTTSLVPSVTLESVLAERGITHWDVPPAVLARMHAPALPSCVANLVVGGEVTPPAVIRAFARRCRVINVYGPTEATICTSMVRCDAQTWERPLIGAPIPGVFYSVKDEELFIGGAALAREYLGDPELTRRRFVELDGERWYRTRDRVRADADGVLEFVGRIDRQVKVNGVLVEPEEIEAALTAYPGIERAAVTRSGGVLTAFVAPRVDRSALTAHLERLLPPSHLPARIDVRDALPVTTSGKVDYTTLATASPAAARKGAEGGLLGTLWAEVLRAPGLTLDDDLRALGASSIDALTVAARAHAAGLAVDPEALASARTLRAMLEPPRPLGADWLRRDAASLGSAPPEAAARGPIGRVLLTGATGFVGGRLLRELLAAGREVVCLVRDPTRLRAGPLVEVIEGDLEREHLGLPPSLWDELASEVTDVIHCAARVNMLSSYAALREANVVGTRRVLDLCMRGCAKRMTHVSTLSVLASADHDGMPSHFGEDFPLERTIDVHGGYAQSKWAAEQVVRVAALPGSSIVRLGLVVGDLATGVMPRHDLLATVVRELARDGRLPRGLPPSLRSGAMPVDWVARALHALAFAPRPDCATYHLVSDTGMTLAMLRRALAELGRPLEDVDTESWLATVAPTVATAALSHALEPKRFACYRALDPFAASHLSFGSDAAKRALAAAGVPACPAPESSLVSAFVRHAVGDLP